jgi:hypothetical protein
MIKKLAHLLLIMILVLNMLPVKSLAAGEFTLIELYDPYKIVTQQPYYNTGNSSITIGISGRGARVVITSYTDTTFTTIGHSKTLYPQDYGYEYFTGIAFSCNVPYIGEIYGENGNLLLRVKLDVKGLEFPECDSSGGGQGSSPTECDVCEMFSCPGWDEYMNKLDDLKAAIPPPPNWTVVAGNFRDAIVPKLVTDMENMLGSSPATPTPRPELPGLDNRGISTKVPQMESVPGLKESGFSSGDIQTQAPEIQFRQDPTGGFDLIQNPIDSLPSFPTDNLPKPGSTDSGEWGKNKPQQTTIPFPTAPIETGDPVTGEIPKPKESTGDTGNTPPTPGDDTGAAPIPGGGSDGGTDPSTKMKDYKPTPDSPDGSGGDFNP